jgi:hypothetical protein
VQLNDDAADGVEQRVTMHRAIAAQVRIAWKAQPTMPGANATSGEATTPLHGGRAGGGFNGQEPTSQLDTTGSGSMRRRRIGRDTHSVGRPRIRLRGGSSSISPALARHGWRSRYPVRPRCRPDCSSTSRS